MLPLRTNTSWPARSSTVAIGGAPGPVTTTSLTFVRVVSEKAASFSNSGLTVTMAATMSILPWMKKAGFPKTFVEHLAGPDSMVVGIK
jgi:hypothetical protein